MCHRISLKSSKALTFTPLILSAAIMCGCGESPPPGPQLLEVNGAVMMKNDPIPHADIYFMPIDNTEGVGGLARSDDTGKFQVMYSRGGSGLPAGTYRVAVSRRVMPDGSPVPPGDDTPEIESPAKETLPPKYSDLNRSQLTVVVQEGSPVEIIL